MQTDLTFAAWLKRKRKEQRLTQETLAGLAGCSTIYLKKIEAGQRQPTRQVVEALLNALHVPQEAWPTYIALTVAPSATPKAEPIGNLPLSLTSFIGREQELAVVEGFLERKTVRLVTLTGPGGVGKTRLALQVAASLRERFDDGGYFVDLAPISDPSLVASTIVETLGIPNQGARPPLDVLKDYLHNKRMLLVLDNLEQVVGAAPLVGEILVAAPSVKVLATSRVALRLRGEQEFAVPPLALPDRKNLPPLSTLSEYAAVDLFVQRALSVKPDFEVIDENGAAVAEICIYLDGLPLAIELAAARIKIFPPRVLLQRLDSRLKTLTGGARDLPARQQTLRDAIGWSYDLLDEAEKTLFRRLGVFVGGFTLEAAEAVGAFQGDLGMDVVDGIALLVDKSLLWQQSGPSGGPRFGMLETIREYALEQLAAHGETERVHREHARFFLMVAEAADFALVGAEQATWFERLTAEQDNLRAALAWTLANNELDWALRFVGALYRFWSFRGHFTEGTRSAEATLALTGDAVRTVACAKALYGAGWLARLQGNGGRAAKYCEASGRILRELGDERGAAYSFHLLGIILGESGDLSRAYSLHHENLVFFDDIEDERGRSYSHFGLGMIAAARAEYATARTHFEQSVVIRRRLGDKGILAYALGWLGLVTVRLGDLAAARAALEEGVAVRRELGDEAGLPASLEALAAVAAAAGQATRAARLFGAAESARATVGSRALDSEIPEYRHNVAVTRAQMAEDDFETTWAEGRAMTLEQAVAYALEEVPTGNAA
ncbi:MAG: helix-turn-helix domain-containing protein [Anaerolineae bacterium]